MFDLFQVDSELLNKLACEGKFQQLEKHLRSLVNFYKQGAGPSCEAANMYHVITSLESMLFSITQMRYGRGGVREGGVVKEVEDGGVVWLFCCYFT